MAFIVMPAIAHPHCSPNTIHPAAVHRGTVCTFGDHRVAMAFTLTGLKAGGIEIDDPRCCAKTFAGYFDAIDAITQT